MRELLGQDISKQQQTSDWGAPELSDAQKDYAASDVRLACVMAEDVDIDPEHLNVMSSNVINDFVMKDVTLKEFTTKLIQYYLDKYNYDVLKVARKLDVGKSTIYRMIQNKEVFVNKKYSLEGSFMN